MAVTHPGAVTSAKVKFSMVGPYVSQFLASPAWHYMGDFISASRQYKVPLGVLLGIAYHESSFFSNTPAGTSVMGAISGPGNHAGLSGAKAQIYAAAATLHGYNMGSNWTGAVNYYNTGNAASGYGASAVAIGNSFKFTGLGAMVTSAAGATAAPFKATKAELLAFDKFMAGLFNHGAYPSSTTVKGNLVTIKGNYSDLPFNLGNGLPIISGAYTLIYNLKTGKVTQVKTPGSADQGVGNAAGSAAAAAAAAGGSAVVAGLTGFLTGLEPAIGNYVRGNLWILIVGGIAFVILIGASMKMFEGGHMPVPVPV